MITITPEPIDNNHSFHAVAESFLQADGLPFADVLSAGSIEQVFRQRSALFGQEDIFSTQIVLWAFLAQALQDGKGASCAAAVEDIATYMHQTVCGLAIRCSSLSLGRYACLRARGAVKPEYIYSMCGCERAA